MRPTTLMWMGVATLLAGVPAAAQDANPGAGRRLPAESRAFGVGVSLGGGSMSVGDDTNSSFVAGVVARLGLDSRNRFQLIGEFHPTKVSSPIIDESFTTINVLAGYTFGRRLKIRPGIGVQYRSWSGSQRVEASDAGLLLGLDAGPELRLTDTLSLSPELVLRYSTIELEGSVGSRLIGVQCVFSWRRAPR